jgi:hypothetical protein
MMKREWYTVGIHLGYNYARSPVVVTEGSPAPEQETARYIQTTFPGARAPHVWLADDRSTLDLFGKGFVLVRLGEDAPSGEGLAVAAAEVGMPFEIITLVEPEAIAAYERKLVLVRPDGHSCWRGDEEPADPAAVIDVVRGARASADAQAARAA